MRGMRRDAREVNILGADEREGDEREADVRGKMEQLIREAEHTINPP